MFSRRASSQGDDLCPFDKQPCVKHQCKLYLGLIGSNPQTGEPAKEYDCAINWQVVVTLEGNKETRQAAAATESFRNEVAASVQIMFPGSREEIDRQVRLLGRAGEEN